MLTSLFPDVVGDVEQDWSGEQDRGEDDDLLGSLGARVQGLADQVH